MKKNNNNEITEFPLHKKDYLYRKNGSRKDPTKTFIGGMIIGTVLGLTLGFALAAFYINETILPQLLNY